MTKRTGNGTRSARTPGADGTSFDPPRQRGPYAKTAERRREILQTAIEVFAESGFRGSSIREIAARVGMTDSGVIHHFRGKGNLLLEVLNAKEAEDAESGAHAGASDPFHQGLVARNSTQRGVVRLFTTLSAEATDPDHPAHKHFVTRYERVRASVRDGLAAEVRQGRLESSIDPELAARLSIAVMDGLQIQWLLDPAMDMSVAYEDFVERYFGSPAAAPASPTVGRPPRRERND